MERKAKDIQPQVQAFFEPVTATFSYIVYDQVGGHAAVIDPVLDYDPKAGRSKSLFAEQILNFLQQQGLTLEWILETHAHADHLSAAQFLKQRAGGKVAIGQRITQVQTVFKRLFHLGTEFNPDGKQFDHLFADDEVFQIGQLRAQALFVPGHTPADLAYWIGDAVFVGDTMFMPDVGSARCDFPGGDAQQLYHSVQRLLALPETTRLFMCHDYPPDQRVAACETSIAAQRTGNIHLHEGISEADFVQLRHQRDAGLAAPVLLLPSIQVNIRAGNFPPAEENGVSYLKIPLNQI